VQQIQGWTGCKIAIPALFLFVYRDFRFQAAREGPARSLCMTHPAEADDLRTLLSLAKKLRGLAEDIAVPTEQELYVTAADVLEKRAGWLATHLPEEGEPPLAIAMPQHVDLLV
jgi:hypothetical protein